MSEAEAEAASSPVAQSWPWDNKITEYIYKKFPTRTLGALQNIFEVFTHFMQLFSFYAPLKYRKTKSFLMFSGRIKRDQWHEMG